MPISFKFSRFILVILLTFQAANSLAKDNVFTIDKLNAGLGPAPAQLDRSSPAATVGAFLDAAHADDFTSIVHLLNLSDVSQSKQLSVGQDLARQLYTIIDRKVVINWAALLDRPDALDANATSDSAVAGQTRRSILLWTLVINDRPYPIRLDRVQVPESQPVWVFSQRTVADIEKLYDQFGPSEMEQKLPNWMRNDAFYNLMWWELIGVPIMLLIATLGGLLTYKVLTRAANYVNREIINKILESTRLPAVILVATSIISGISGIFVFSGSITTFLSPLLALGYVLAILMFVINVIDRVIDQLVEFDHDNLREADNDGRREMATKVSVARRMLLIIIVLVGSGVVLSEANVFRTFGFSLLASAGAVTLVLGFAAREVLSNIMSSMQIAINKSARIGDKVVYKGHLCNVERINFTYVLLREWTGVRLIVPVNEFVAESFENWTIKEPQMTRLIVIRVAHSADVAKLREIFKEVMDEANQDELGSNEEHTLAVTNQNVFGQELTFCVSCANPNTSWIVSCGIREELIKRMQALKKTGCEIFPNAEPAQGA